jgi:predicted regulator of Ras-like GTPase activity (Roadblock/LC7/MglB family)
MSAIRETLEDLRHAAGVKGAALLTTDGLVAAASLDDRYASDVVAGLTSYLLMTTNRSLAEAGLGQCSQFVLHATHGRAVFVSLGESYLVVLLDQFADVEAARPEIQEAALRIRRSARLG